MANRERNCGIRRLESTLRAAKGATDGKMRRLVADDYVERRAVDLQAAVVNESQFPEPVLEETHLSTGWFPPISARVSWLIFGIKANLAPAGA